MIRLILIYHDSLPSLSESSHLPVLDQGCCVLMFVSPSLALVGLIAPGFIAWRPLIGSGQLLITIATVKPRPKQMSANI